jgi:hypothetical protein
MAILETERNERIVKWSAVLEMAIECGNPYRLPFCSVLSVRFSSARRKAGQSKRRYHILGLKNSLSGHCVTFGCCNEMLGTRRKSMSLR